MVGVEFEDNTAAVSAQLMTELRDLVATMAQRIADEAKANTPPRVDTGALMNGFYWYTTGPLEANVTNDVEYFPYQELGTRHISGHFMLTRAVDQVKPEFEAGVAKVIGQ